MRDDSYPHPVSDPEADGIPGYADDDSTAWDDVDSGRIADGPEPAALPSDIPLAVDRYGTTAEEQRVGEPLDYKLGQERPDPALEQDLAPVREQPGPTLEQDLAPAWGQPGPTPDEADPDALEYAVQGALDDPDLNAAGPSRIGRIVEPDEGLRPDDEKDMIGRDAGAAGGGASAEELAMHEEPAPDHLPPD